MSVYWINLEGVRLGITPRPRGNDWLADDLRILRQAGVDVLVSALTASEAEELGLSSEAQECVQNGLVFISFPIEDRSVPTGQAKLNLLVDQLLHYSKKRKSYCCPLSGRNRAFVAHCRLCAGKNWASTRGCVSSDRKIEGLPCSRYTRAAAMGHESFRFRGTLNEVTFRESYGSAPVSYFVVFCLS